MSIWSVRSNLSPTKMRLFSSTSAACSVVGRWPIKFPSDVSIMTEPLTAASSATVPSAKSMVRVCGPLGEISMPLHPFVRLESAKTDDSEKSISVRVENPSDKQQRAMWGTTRGLINNMVMGVSEGFTVPIRLVGVGYRAAIEKVSENAAAVAASGKASVQDRSVLSLRLGFSHPVVLEIPNGVKATVPAPQHIVLQGIDLQQLTQFAASIRKWRKPEPYNQKGIFVGDETIKKKEGKKR